LCWISLLSRVGVVVNNLWEILFLTHRARFVRRALEIESRRTTPRSSEYAERASVCAGAPSAPRKTRKSGNKSIRQSLATKFPDSPAARTSNNSRQQSDQPDSDQTDSEDNKFHSSRTSSASGRADSTFGSMGGTAPCPPGTTDLVVLLSLADLRTRDRRALWLDASCGRSYAAIDLDPPQYDNDGRDECGQH
jgi:hypothetical protein